jgi:predicted helicase
VADRDKLRAVKTFPSLVKYLRDELDWPIDTNDFDSLTFDYEPEELGIDPKNAAKIEEIKQLRPLVTNQPWGIFFIKFEPKQLPIVALRRILSQLVIKKRVSSQKADRPSWNLNDLLLISNYGQGEERQITFAQFTQAQEMMDLPILRVLGWDDADTALHIDHVHKVLSDNLHWPKNEDNDTMWREQWSSAFTLRHREVIDTSKDLAKRLAGLAIRIRNRAKLVISIETERGTLRKLHKAFQTALIHDLNENDFADMYAQTIAYGLLTARVSRPAGIIADNLADMVPITNPFLKEMLGMFLTAGGRKGKFDFDELGIGEVINLLNSPDTHMEDILRDFGNRTQKEDPVIHFYELFLKEYDPVKKVKRGVFYTPQPIVSYIVRSVDELLRTEFGLEDGLADTATWGEMLMKHSDLKLPIVIPRDPNEDDSKDILLSPDQPFVQILDPAVGTATFLVEVIDIIYKTMKDKWLKSGHMELEIQSLWNAYVPEHLLPRLFGYELMMAPYAVAHMRIGLKLYETGYRFGSNERARIYLTNALEPASSLANVNAAGLFDILAHEAQEVNEIKRKQRFTAIIGNPPYAGHSLNNHIAWIVNQIHDYKRGIAELAKPAQAKWLQDDYVKFIRFAETAIESSTLGILGYITNHSYLDNPTFRGMRQHLLMIFDEIFILDLHGNMKKREVAPDGSPDQNVFEIQQGVCIALAVRKKLDANKKVAFSELVGTREWKCDALGANNMAKQERQQLAARPTLFLLRPSDASLRREYDTFMPLPNAMAVNGDPAPGIVTTHDDFAISWSKDEVVTKVNKLLSAKDEEEARKLFRLCSQSQWNYSRARMELPRSNWQNDIGVILYRPFDPRWTVFNHHVAVHCRMRASRHFFGKTNLGLCVGKAGQVVGAGEWNLVSCTRHPVDFNYFYRGGACNFPLYLMPPSDGLALDKTQNINFADTFIKAFAIPSQAEARVQITNIDFEAKDLFSFIYSVLHSPGYRSRYAEFLKIDFPRIPLPSSLDLFQDLVPLGGKLVAMHLMESPELNQFITTYSGPKNPEVERIGWSDNAVWLDATATKKGQPPKPGTIGFRGVPEEVWNFHIGGYQVCEKWLKDRKGRELSKDDIEHYQKIVVALSETIRLMGEIDKVIDKHGGWPGAFK